jgi:alkylation response protein AidB-like acyl-CoA dehydrogenase
MNIALTDEQIAYRDRFRAWLDVNLPDHRVLVDEDANTDLQKGWERTLHEAGYAGIALPKHYGGQGLGAVEHWIIAEELGLRAAPEGMMTANVL